jgi:FrmR/RcnR family transcriptional regulator, repressor of frmRAB operon
MAHTIKDKKNLLHRVRRIRGQLDAVERALVDERDCAEILQTLAACRGAISSLTAEVIEGHVRFHIVKPDGKSPKGKAASQLIHVVRTYLK